MGALKGRWKSRLLPSGPTLACSRTRRSRVGAATVCDQTMSHLRLKRSRPAVVAAALVSLTSVSEAATIGLAELVRDAELIVAVKVLSTDETAMPADGPMYVDAKILKVVKGPLRGARNIRFGASAWVGPTYRSGEERIVFLNPIPRRHAYYAKASWSSLEAGKVDVFFVHETLDDCSEASLRDLLKTTETLSQASLKLESQLVQAPDTGRRLFIRLVNNSSQTLWLNLFRMVTRVEANPVKYALAVTWDRTAGQEWVSLPPADRLSGSASAEQLAGASELTITLTHRSVRFPHASWIGSRSITVTTPE